MKVVLRIFRRILKILGVLLLLLLLFIGIQYLWTGTAPESQPDLAILSHRAIHHDYQRGVYDVRTGCEAQHIFPPTHELFGNTIPSIDSAFALGADIVEIDLRRTLDSNLVVFHDFQLSCRTNAAGLVREYTVEQLKKLDVGHGYTADSGQTYPLRGKGLGLMVTLEEVLYAFPKQSFLLDHKDWDQASFDILVRILANIPPSQRAQLYFWSNASFQARLQSIYPEVAPLFLTRPQARKDFGPFLLSFGLIDIPEKHAGRVMALPADYLPYVWGWPYRFLEKVHAANMKFYVMVDDPAQAVDLKALPIDGIVTDHIETVGPAFLKTFSSEGKIVFGILKEQGRKL